MLNIDIKKLNEEIKDFEDRSRYLKEEVIEFLSSLKLRFKNGLDVTFYDPSNGYMDYTNQTTIYAMDSDGIWFDKVCEDDGIEYDDMCLDDLVELAKEVIESPEFKKKYLE